MGKRKPKKPPVDNVTYRRLQEEESLSNTPVTYRFTETSSVSRQEPVEPKPNDQPAD